MITERLYQGEENALTMRELCRIFRADDRTIRARIHEERKAGSVILASNEGFFLPAEDPEKALQEVKSFERRMKSRARKELEAVKSAARERKRLEEVTG